MAKYKISTDPNDQITIIDEYGVRRVLRRIIALKTIVDKTGHIIAKKGDKGGYVQSERNLSQYGRCWIANDAMVFDNAEVRHNAQIRHSAKIYNWAKVYDNAEVSDNAKVFQTAYVSGKSCIRHFAEVYGDAKVYGKVLVRGYAKVYDKAKLFNQAVIAGCAEVSGTTYVSDKAKVYGKALVKSAHIWGCAEVFDNASVHVASNIYGYAKVYGNAYVSPGAEISDYAEVFGNASIWLNGKVYDRAKVYGKGRVGYSAKVFGDAEVFGTSVDEFKKVDVTPEYQHTAPHNTFKKYEISHESKAIRDKSGKIRYLHRIVALKDIFGNDGKIIAKKGDKGGFVESEDNLSQEGYCWIADDAMVYGKAQVFEDATVYNNARVYGNTILVGDAEVSGDSEVYGNVWLNRGTIKDDTKLYTRGKIFSRLVLCHDGKEIDNRSLIDKILGR